MKKNCLTCKYEPDWSEWSGGEYSRQYGSCKWNGELKDRLKESLPETYTITIKNITRYSDDSGTMNRCPLWEAKP